ncbi:MAG: ATP-binding protein [Leptolyngbyaceae cyanobacterium MO_188.B28]|nr:ATP-binding protein [Leptolyngbyaceae cyanobacterium MO_188.B28]
MLRPRPRSFRRILLLRILLVSIPIMLMGQYVALRKARTSLLDTARQNLTSSATRKAEDIGLSIQSLQANLQTVSQTSMLQSGTLSEAEAQLSQFTDRLSFRVNCIQLNQGQTDEIALSTCDTSLIPAATPLPWLGESVKTEKSSYYLVSVAPSSTNQPSTTRPNPSESSETNWQEIDLPEDRYANFEVVLATPVYSPAGRLRYTLSIRAILAQLENTGPQSLVGDTVIIDQDGKILIHPDIQQVGKSISEVGDSDRLESILGNVRAGNRYFLHLFSFLPQENDTAQTGNRFAQNLLGFFSTREEWLAGYNGIEVSISPQESHTWTILAVTPLENALQGLKDISQVLIWLTLGLFTANCVLALYIARGLSLPIERLVEYAQEIQDLSHLKEAPRNFKIYELNNLARVLTGMMKRLEERARELRHAWQDAQLANQLKSEFLANTSHELRTPLNAIIGCIRLVRDGCCDDRNEELEFLERADNAAIHLLRIINDILDIAKIESGTLALKIESVDLRQVLEEVIDLQTVQIQQKGLELIKPELKSLIFVRADRSKLKQVLLNIVNNAIKFTEAGSITIAVQVEPISSQAETLPENGKQAKAEGAESTASRVLIAIKDTGIGIDPKQQQKLFRPFVMVDGSTTRKFEGTGLGLAISKNLINLMGGNITLHSDGLMKGATVVVMLPVISNSDIDLEDESPHFQQRSQDNLAESEAIAIGKEV